MRSIKRESNMADDVITDSPICMYLIYKPATKRDDSVRGMPMVASSDPIPDIG